MNKSSSAFLLKSIILLGLVLMCMGVSMYLGKGLGRSIMDFTKENVDENFGELNITDSDNAGQNEAMQYSVPSETGSAEDITGSNQNSFEYPEGGSNPDQFPMSDADPRVDLEILPADESDNQVNLFDLGDRGTTNEPDESQAEDQDTDVIEFIPPVESDSTFRIQVGTFRVSENAESLWNNIRRAGDYNPSITSYTNANDGTVMYRVQVGMYDSREEAEIIAEELRNKGFVEARVREVQ